MYLLTIYEYNQEVVHEYFNTLEEAQARIEAWPWNFVHPDYCSPSLYKELTREEGGI